MEVHITSLITDWAVGPECKCKRVGPYPTNLGVRGFEELTISMAECKGLAFSDQWKNDQVNQGELTRVATTSL
jgi:hypothetical protein